MAARVVRGWLVLVGLTAMAATGVGAQQDPDSTAARLRERLELLGRPPGDSTAAVPLDSLPELTGVRILPGDPSGGAADDLVSQLRALPGYSAALYNGLSAEYYAREGMLYLHGDSTRPASLERVGDRLRADSLIEFDESTSEIRALGQPVFIPLDGDEVRSQLLFWNLDREEGAALEANMEYDEGANWIVTGDLPSIRPELAYGHKTRFTSCELDTPHYHFETDELKISRGRILVAKSVKLYFGDVPVAWLPFIAQSLARGRASGLLTPRFSVNDIVRTSGGYRRRVSNLGFYWAMSEYSDAIVAFDWFDDNYTALTGNIQYRWLRQFLDGGLSMRQFWRAEGGTELTLNTRHNWEISERTRFTASGSYASSSRFISQNSFNPQELTRSIDSKGGLSHRFDWGSLNLAANRRQFLTDDRVEMTLPDLSLSLKTVTLLSAPVARARWYNNLTWSGGGNLRRSVRDFSAESGTSDDGTLSGNLSSSLNLGALSISGSVNYREATVRDVFRDSLVFFPQRVADMGIRAFQTTEGRAAAEGELVDVGQTTLDWSSSIRYQQNLIGSTTLTPNITFAGSAKRADTISVAQNFVSAPSRVSFGATLKSDIYGFFPGFGSYERIRHKMTPQISYDWSPEVQPTELQERVFQSRSLQPTNVISLSLNQTFEAKPEGADSADAAGAAGGPGIAGAAQAGAQVGPDGLRRLPTTRPVTLLALRTSVVKYDFVEADSLGFLYGFTNTQLTNTISSDFLRGLSVSMTHDLFEDRTPDGAEGETPLEPERVFDPHLSRLNLGFALTNRSGIFRWLGFGGDDQPPPLPEEIEEAEAEALQEDMVGGVTDEASIIPGNRDRRRTRRPSAGNVGEWSANLSYALNRPRSGLGVSQMLQINVRLQPTAQWEMSWQTAYDLEASKFNDHMIRLSRDLHRWQAHFDFLQTATGNWSFRFEVSLLDNEDLKFDYEQRSTLDAIRRAGTGG